MIRIAYLIDTIVCDTAGTQKQLLETIKRLDKSAFTPHLICLWESEWMRQHALPCDHTVLGYRGFIKPNFPKVIHRLHKLIHCHEFHIIQTFFEDAIFVGFLGGFLSRPRPILLSSRRDMGLGEGNQPIYHRLYKLSLPFVNKSFAGIVTNSTQIKAYVAKRERTKPGKIKVVCNGIDIVPSTEEIPDLLLKYRCDVRIGIVASLTPVKRHDLFLNAFALLKSAISGLRFNAVLLGDGPEKGKLIQLARHLDIHQEVIFAGAVNNVGAYLPHLDIGVLCSDREGLSNAIMEYMAASLPVIATAVGGNVELVDTTNGICVPSGNPQALANAMQQLVEDQHLRKRLGQGSLVKLRENYSWSKTMTLVENYYRNLVSRMKNC